MGCRTRRSVRPVFQQMHGESVPQHVYHHPLAEFWRDTRRAAGGMKYLHIDWSILAPAGKQPVFGVRQTPVGTQDVEELGRQHDVAVLVTLAVHNAHDHPMAVDIADPQADGLR